MGERERQEGKRREEGNEGKNWARTLVKEAKNLKPRGI